MTYSPEMIYYMGGHAPLNIIVIWDEALLDQVEEKHLELSEYGLSMTHSGFGRQGAKVSAADSEEGCADRGGEHTGAAGGGHVGAVAGNGAGNA